MEMFKDFDDILRMDKKHGVLDQVSVRPYRLELLHKALADLEIKLSVPDDIHGQFNVARNMALYTYFFYALAPVVHLKTYIIIEHALRVRSNAPIEKTFKMLLKQAVSEGWIIDSGFRHIDPLSKGNPYSHSLIDLLPRMRNGLAHGSNMLDSSCLRHIQICCDLVNQLFPK